MSTLNSNPIAKAVRVALLAGAATAVSMPAVYAQEADDEEETVVITGSRLKRTDIEGASPITSVTRDQILRSGMTNVGELLQRLPEITGSPLATTINNGGNGAVLLDIRGLGRTLTLINGRRTPDGGDFQTIPLGIVERIDILKDGASTVYGTDAIAGVVNVITRKDFTGLQVFAQRSDNFDTDSGANDTISLIAGSEGDKGRFMLGIDYNKQEPILQSDTPWDFMQNSFFVLDPVGYQERGFITPIDDPTNFTVGGFGSSRIPNGNFNLNGNSAFGAGCGSVTADSAFGDPNSYRCYNGSFSDPNNDSYNYAPVNFLQTPFERINLFLEAEYEISPDHTFYTEMRVNQRFSQQRLAPVPFDTQFDPGFEVAVLDATGAQIATANGISGQNVYNPFGEDIIRARRRMIERNRIFNQDVTQFQYVAGVSGILTDGWDYDVSWNYGYRHRTDVDQGQFVGERLSNALGPSFIDGSGNPVCGTPGNVISGCVPLNLFGGEGTVTDAMYDYISADLVDKFDTTLQMINGSITGELFEMDGGTAGIVLGYEHQDLNTQFTPDSGKATDAVTGNTGGPVGGGFTITSFFGELGLPITEELDVTLGVRADDYSTDVDNVAYQLGATYRPMDGLLIRGTIGTSFRGPSINELFSPLTDNFPQLQDPCRNNGGNWDNLSATQQANCVAQGVPDGGYFQADTQIRGRVGGNPELGPEEGESVTFGISYSPDFLEGFNITVDYWNIEIDGIINSLSASALLNNCTNLGTNCNTITRFFDGRIDAVESNNQNLGRREAEGFDWNISYAYDTDFGSFRHELLYTYLDSRVEFEFDGAQPWVLDGTIDDNTVGGAFPNHRANINTNWSYGDWSVSHILQFVGDSVANFSFFGAAGLAACGGGADTCGKVPSQTYHDLTANYTLDTGTTVTFGITNLFDKAPVFFDSGFNASTDPSTYRLFGRGYVLRAVHEF